MKLRGFGILEVLISGTMLVLGLAGVVSFAAHANQTAGHQRHITIASHVAEMQMEKLLLLFADDARLANGSHTGLRYDDIGNLSATGIYQTTWQITTSSPVPGARTVVVTVTWTEAGRTRTTSMRTIRS